MRLLIINYSMSSTNLVFSHQAEVVRALANSFSETIVVTAEAESSDIRVNGNFRVILSVWRQGKRLENIFRFYKFTLPILFKTRGLVVFSHMTEVQSLLIAPICWILRIEHYLWYAHASKSPYLYLSYPFLTKVLTSTRGSCPIKGKKVLEIGQAIDESEFSTDFYPAIPPLKWYYVGRIDPSKKIELIIETIGRLRWRSGLKITLDIFGAASSPNTKKYENDLQVRFSNQIADGWLTFKGPILRSKIKGVALEHDGFINAFIGSLDKALVEATMSRRFVVTSNPEYLSCFYSRGNAFLLSEMNLDNQVNAIIRMNREEAMSLLDSNFEKAIKYHSLNVWIETLAGVLKDE